LHYQGTDNLEVMADAANYNRFLADLVLQNSGASHQAVDFGAGIGTIALMVRGRGLDVICVEMDAAQRDTLAACGVAAFPDLDALRDGTMPYIYSLNVLEHIKDDQLVVDDLARKLSPGGRLFIYVPAFQALFSSMDRKVGHFRRYRRTQLVRLIERAGLTVVRAKYVDSLGFLATLLYKLLGSNTGDLNRRSIVVFDRIVFPVSRLFDLLLGRMLGKNLYVVATKQASAARALADVSIKSSQSATPA
jgi:SAM-dependent methyltransferase